MRALGSLRTIPHRQSSTVDNGHRWPDAVLHDAPATLGRLLDLQPVVVVDQEDFRHEGRTHGVVRTC
jgi:hypothetical protein